MKKALNPSSVRQPFGNYNHGLFIPHCSDVVVTSGQLGISPMEQIPDDVEQQAVLCFEAIRAILAEADMDFTDVVRIAGFVTSRDYFGPYMAVRDRYTSAPLPVSTLLIVSGFTRAEFKVEVEVTAMRSGV